MAWKGVVALFIIEAAVQLIVGQFYGGSGTEHCDPRTMFTCNNGNCISILFTCDGFNDCGDDSDENQTMCKPLTVAQTFPSPASTSTPGPTPPATSPPPGYSGGLRGAQCIPDVAPPHSSCLPDSPNLIKTISFPISDALSAHNDVRTAVNNQPPGSRIPRPASPIPLLQWNNELAVTAERHCAQCLFQHDTAAQRVVPDKGWTWVGQNIYMAWSTNPNFNPTWNKCVSSWASENTTWTYGVGCTGTEECGHWTQVIWATSLFVGCGEAKCTDGFYFCCNYGPGGNIQYGSVSAEAYPYVAAVGGM